MEKKEQHLSSLFQKSITTTWLNRIFRIMLLRSKHQKCECPENASNCMWIVTELKPHWGFEMEGWQDVWIEPLQTYLKGHDDVSVSINNCN